MRKTRMTLELDAEAYETLEQLSRETGRSKGEILRQGLSLRQHGQQCVAKGGSLAVVDDNNQLKYKIYLL